MNDMRRAGPNDIKKKTFSDSIFVLDKLRRCAIAGHLISNGRGIIKNQRGFEKQWCLRKEVCFYGTYEWGFYNEGGLYSCIFS